MSNTQVLILDFGSQYTQLLVRRIREANVYAEVLSFHVSCQKIKTYPNLKAIILSGEPESVYLQTAYQLDEAIFQLPFAILGICYGMQLLTNHFQEKVELANTKEFGKANLYLDQPANKLFNKITNLSSVWR